MNRVIITLFVAFAFVACDTNQESDLDKLIAKRDSLQTLVKDLNVQITELDTNSTNESAYVSVDTVTMGTFEHFFEIQGIVEAKNNVTIVAEIPAVITQIHVDEGQEVKKGSLLVSLDSETIVNQINELKTKLKLATFVYQKQSNLREENIGSELDYETALNNKEALESALETANSQLAKTKIVAPYDGIVDDIFPREGELAGPQYPMIRFVSLGDVSINVDIPESYLSKINVGDEVEVSFPDLGISHISKVYQTGSFIQPLNRTFKVTINLPSDKNLLPNLIGVVRVRDLVIEDAVMIKQKNILQNGVGDDYVFKIGEEEGQTVAKKIFIEKGASYKDQTYIVSGLSKNDLIVSKGARSIVDGETVRWDK